MTITLRNIPTEFGDIKLESIYLIENSQDFIKLKQFNYVIIINSIFYALNTSSPLR